MGACRTLRAAALMAALVLAGCGSSSNDMPSSATDAPAITDTTSSPSNSDTTSTGSTSGYSGIGAPAAAFNAQHPHGQSPPPLGVAYYTVDAKNAAGRVTAFEVENNSRPPDSDRERLGLLSGVSLPDDATETDLNGDTCLVWRSAKLKKLIGLEYAAATTTTGAKTAQMTAKSTPRC